MTTFMYGIEFFINMCYNVNMKVGVKMEKLSRYISYLLRHHPEDLDLKMDSEGWVNARELIKKINDSSKYHISKQILEEIVANDNKGRFVFSGSGHDFIRACQGHSIKTLNLKFEEKEPPEVLYHGTSTRYYQIIKTEGIKPMTRQYVHLSKDLETAEKVGTRHGELKIITINTKKMYEDGIKFYLSENGVWLTDYVNPKYFIY